MDRIRNSIRSTSWNASEEIPMAFSDKSAHQSIPLWRRVVDIITCPFRVLPTVLVSSVPFLILLYGLRGYGPANGNTITENARCQLRDRFHDGSFLVGSHRSFVDYLEKAQPTCEEALTELQALGVRYLDLDLVYGANPHDEASEIKILYLAHPMEYFRTSHYYSPCSLVPLADLLGIMNSLYTDEPWFVTLEPKASWGGEKTTKKKAEKSKLAPSTEVLAALLQVAQEHSLQPSHCALILGPGNGGTPEESNLINELQEHCALDLSMRLNDLVPAIETLKLSGFEYQYLMPTIEFHPDHSSHPDTLDEESLIDIRQTIPKSIFWIIDTREDLQMAASVDAYGIVSNRPREIVKWISDEKWCSIKSNDGD